MKTVIIGDTHGRIKFWDIINKEKDADKIVFIGDYVDSYDPSQSVEEQAQILEEIINLKKNDPDKYVLLIGNHDLPYIHNIDIGISRYSSKGAKLYTSLFKDNIELFDIIYQIPETNILITHAGITNTWLNNNRISNEGDIVEDIKNIWRGYPEYFSFLNGYMGDNYGNEITQSPIWVRPQSLAKDLLDGYEQVVGHTQFGVINCLVDNIWFIDCLETSNEYLTHNNEIKDKIPFKVETI